MSSPISSDIGQVFIPVRDIRASAAWYGALLGFEPEEDQLSHGETIYDIPTVGQPRLSLDANKPDFVASGPARFFFWTADMDATVRHLHAMGADGLSEVLDIGSVSFLTLEDPDGNLLMVAQPNHN